LKKIIDVSSLALGTQKRAFARS